MLIAADMDTGECLEMDRFNNLDWPFQKGRIKAFVEKWDALLVMDETGGRRRRMRPRRGAGSARKPLAAGPRPCDNRHSRLFAARRGRTGAGEISIRNGDRSTSRCSLGIPMLIYQLVPYRPTRPIKNKLFRPRSV